MLFLYPALAFGQATNIYITPDGNPLASPSLCTSSVQISSPAFFNNSSNWGSGNGKIGQGTTVHLCGTFTANAGSSGYLTFHGGGNNVNPITLLFDTNTVIQAPYWGGAVISAGSYQGTQNYIIVDGGTNGVIQATANGTDLANQQSNGTGVYFLDVSSSVIRNLTIQNMYVHDSVSNTNDTNGGGTFGIEWESGNNVSIYNVTVHDARWGIFYEWESTYADVNIFNNTEYNCDHGVVLGDGNNNSILNTAAVYENTFYNGANWDTTSDTFHHDGIHTWAEHRGSQINGLLLYNNYSYGDMGVNNTADIFIDAGSGGVIPGVSIFNNIFSNISHGLNNGQITTSGTNTNIYNNTFVSTTSLRTTAIFIPSAPPIAKNNIFSNVGSAFNNDNTTVKPSQSDYNDFYNVGSIGVWYNYVTLAQWQAQTGLDVHSSTANPNLTASFMPNAGSPAIGASINLTSYCSIYPALCLDRNGSQRPMCGSWDTGAYQYCTSNCNSATCAPAFVAQPQNQTVAVGQTATFTVLAIGNPLPTYQWYENNVAIADATSFMYTTPAATAGDNGAVFDCVLSGLVTSSTATLTVTGAPSPSTSTVAAGLNAALVYPDPATSSYDPTIRICPGGPASGGADIGVTIYDVSGRAVNSSDAFSFIGVPLNGVGAGQFECYEYKWTGHKASGIYFAVVHAKGSGTTVKAKLKFAVVSRASDRLERRLAPCFRVMLYLKHARQEPIGTRRRRYRARF